MDAVEARTLVPLGAIDASRMVMPAFKDTVTGEVGALKELSERPGALWHASWIPGQPWYVRLEDGSTAEVRPEELS